MHDMKDIRLPAGEDMAIEAVVLRQLLALFPIQLTVGELEQEIAGENGDFAQVDAVERAIRELSTAGLIHRVGDVVLPSRAALRLDALLG